MRAPPNELACLAQESVAKQRSKVHSLPELTRDLIDCVASAFDLAYNPKCSGKNCWLFNSLTSTRTC